MDACLHIESRFPAMGTTIFTVMSRLANECGAINLSQGFPDFQAEPLLFERVFHHMQAGLNQYAPMAGLPVLRQAISDKIAQLYGTRFDPEEEVTVTAGATQALFTAIAALVRPGDEVIVLEPVYDSYIPAIETVGGVVRSARLHYPDYRPNWDEVRALITPRTRLIIVNSPHNPTGSLLTRADLDQLAALVEGSNIAILSDEVYEHISFTAEGHASLCGHPQLAARTLVVSSFGKTYHITGWKIGYVVGPARLMAEFRKVHQFNVFTVHAPSQAALADYMQDATRHLQLADFYRAKRDHFRHLLADTPFRLLPCDGTYFQLASYAGFSKLPDRAFAEWLTRDIGVAVIPISVFHRDGRDDQVVRFCFAKRDETLEAAAQRLRQLG